MSIKKIVIGGAAAAALGIAALAGTGTAFAGSHQSSTVQHVSQGASKAAASVEKAGNETAAASDGPGGHADANGVDVQQGDQSAPDTATSAEKAGNETGVSDGPGGHADATGSTSNWWSTGDEEPAAGIPPGPTRGIHGDVPRPRGR